MTSKVNQTSNGKAPAIAEPLHDATKQLAASTNGQNGQPKESVQEVITPQLTVEDKIQKVNILRELIEKREVIKTHLYRVEAMKFGDFDEKDVVNIVSQDGKTYAIKSSLLCEKIANLLKDEFAVKIKDIETQIQF